MARTLPATSPSTAALLGGTGSVSGAVTVNSGAHLAPGASIESLGVGSLDAECWFGLGLRTRPSGTSDLVDVNGLLTLNGGSFNFVDRGRLDRLDLYNLIDYGTVSGSFGELGAPTGPAGFNYSLVDTGSVISLSFRSIGVLGDFNDDGMVDAADYVVWRKAWVRPTRHADYDDVADALWRDAANAGLVAAEQPVELVPEPTSVALLLIGWLPLCCRRRVDGNLRRKQCSRSPCACPSAQSCERIADSRLPLDWQCVTLST